MNWTLASQIATSIGVLLGAFSLGLGLWRYRTTKRNEYVTRLRETIGTTKAAVQQLNSLLTYDLAYDVIASVVYKRDLAVVAKEVYYRFFNLSDVSENQPDVSAQALENYLQNEFPFIYVSINTPLLASYDTLMQNVRTAIEAYKPDYPALYRVLWSVTYLFSFAPTLYNIKARDETIWKLAIIHVYTNSRNLINDYRELQYHIIMYFVEYIEKMRRDSFQEDIKDISSLLDLVAGAYTSKTNRQLFSVSKVEQKKQYTPVENSLSIEELLREAEKGLISTLDEIEIIKYNDLLLRSVVESRRVNS